MEEKSNFLKNKSGWIVLSVAFAVLITASFLGGNITGFVTAERSGDEAVTRLLSLLELDSPGLDREVKSITEESGFLIIEVDMGGQIVPFYTSIDGKYLIYEVDTFDDIEEYIKLMKAQEAGGVTQPVQPTQVAPVDYEVETLDDFISCLYEQGIMIYGSVTCPHCTTLANTLGGKEVVSPIYVECTEEPEICQQEQIAGVPTIKLNGQQINIARTLEGFSSVTGCPLPSI